jgi:hypothetical protein
MYEGVDTVVLYNELAYEDVLPVQWQSIPGPPASFELIGLEQANLLLLQACVATEEHPLRESGEDAGPTSGEIARLDFKLNLILHLLSRLLQREPMPPPTPIQFNAVGASWIAMGAPPSVGAFGLCRIQLRSSLPQPLELPSEVTSVEGSSVQVRFPALSEGIVELIQRLAFLRHRRRIADRRKARDP